MVFLSTTLTEEQIRRAEEFHGHWCPGLAWGIRAAEWALREVGCAGDEDVVTVAETDMCGVDALQVLLSCTAGKGNLLIRNRGKVAFSFYRRGDGVSLRLVARPLPDPAEEETRTLRENPCRTAEQEARLGELRAARARRILELPLEELFERKETTEPVPPVAPMEPSVVCAACGEKVMETHARLRRGRVLCEACFETEMPRK